MNVADIKNIWKNDMNALEQRVQINEEKIKVLEFNKAQTGFDQLLKISLAGKNMALVYAIISLGMIYLVRDSYAYIGMLLVASGVMIFSYFQHRVLKKIDYGKLSLIQLQKEIAKFRVHTARTAIYDTSIVTIWLLISGLAFMKWFEGYDIFLSENKWNAQLISIVVVFIGIILLSKFIYKDYDKKLKKYEEDLDVLTNYERQ